MYLITYLRLLLATLRQNKQKPYGQHLIRLGLFTRLKTIDAMSDGLLFSHRISIGKLIESKPSDLDLIDGILFTIHGIRLKASHYPLVITYVDYLLKSIKSWYHKESTLLKYTPTPEEQQAGIEQISRHVQEFGTIDAIAQRMHISHDAVMQTPYPIIFMMLLKDLEQSKFERRLHKIYNRKHAYTK